MPSAERPTSARAYVPALTGLRAFGALLVFIHHYQQNYGVPSYLDALAHEGYLGVSMFFTLSGYLITRIYFERFAQGRLAFREYWVKRFARVYPPYFVLLVFKIMVSGVAFSGAWFAWFTMTHAFFPSLVFTGLTPAWSLTVEECFYLSAPLVFLLLARYGRGLGATAAVLVLTTVAFWGLGYNLSSLTSDTSFLSTQTIVWVYNIFGRFGEFAVGMFLARVLASRDWRPANTASAIVPELRVTGFVAGLVGAMFAMQWLARQYGGSYGILMPYGVFPLWFVSVGTALLIWGAVDGSRVAAVILGNPVVEYLGRISYVMYLLQDGFIASNYFVLMPGANWVIDYIALNGAAACVYHLVEHPVHGWLTSRPWLIKPKQARHVATAG